MDLTQYKVPSGEFEIICLDSLLSFYSVEVFGIMRVKVAQEGFSAFRESSYVVQTKLPSAFRRSFKLHIFEIRVSFVFLMKICPRDVYI